MCDRDRRTGHLSVVDAHDFQVCILIGPCHPAYRKILIIQPGDVHAADRADLKVVRVHNGEVTGTAVTIAHMSESRRSGFPQMVLQEDALVFAWTEAGETNQVKIATLDASGL